MSDCQRPLSPHLSIYRPQLTSMLSILHRFTGVGLFVGSFLFVGWFVALSLGEESYQSILSFLESLVGQLLLSGWVFAFYYHLFNGLRHFYWDIGRGFDLETTYKTGWLVLGASISLTVITLIFMMWR